MLLGFALPAYAQEAAAIPGSENAAPVVKIGNGGGQQAAPAAASPAEQFSRDRALSQPEPLRMPKIDDINGDGQVNPVPPSPTPAPKIDPRDQAVIDLVIPPHVPRPGDPDFVGPIQPDINQDGKLTDEDRKWQK